MTAPRSLWSGIVVNIGWGIIGALWITTVARVVAWDRVELFAILDAFTLILYLPALPIAAFAAWSRHWVLAGAAVAMIVAQIVFIAPEFSAATSIPGNLRGAATLRAFDANVDQNNPSMAGYAEEIRRDRPDLVTLEEASPLDLHELVARHTLTRLPYRFWNGAFGSRSLVIASHYPLGATVVTSVDGLVYLARTTMELPHGHLVLWVVHTTAPTVPGVQQWNDELEGVHQLLRAAHPHPLLIVGDFNATWTNRGFRAILSTGLTDAAAARGDDLAMTWSQLMAPVPPLIRIDHVLTGPGVIVTSIHTESGPGSDHRDLLATVVLLK